MWCYINYLYLIEYKIEGKKNIPIFSLFLKSKLLNEILYDKRQKIIKKAEFKDILNKDYIDKKNPKNGNFELRYGDKNIDIAFHYLEKTKKLDYLM